VYPARLRLVGGVCAAQAGPSAVMRPAVGSGRRRAECRSERWCVRWSSHRGRRPGPDRQGGHRWVDALLPHRPVRRLLPHRPVRRRHRCPPNSARPPPRRHSPQPSASLSGPDIHENDNAGRRSRRPWPQPRRYPSRGPPPSGTRPDVAARTVSIRCGSDLRYRAPHGHSSS
jgi:hypothetical protein